MSLDVTHIKCPTCRAINPVGVRCPDCLAAESDALLDELLHERPCVPCGGYGRLGPGGKIECERCEGSGVVRIAN